MLQEYQEYLLYFEQREKDVRTYEDYICYSPRYYDDLYEYRHVTLPKQLVQYVPLDRLMPEDEWRSLGVKQSPGWEHYMIHAPEPHILLFKREKDYQLKYGLLQPEEELVEQDGQIVQYSQGDPQKCGSATAAAVNFGRCDLKFQNPISKNMK
ncbi:CKS-domain-containing protein [Gigaspora margarita]|uniref:Cyclin-dependent kinases regulatory subunit n=1 Tax=Gigaspora margarita TaxID=4874 RepID=A0A8H4B343_GIGMA|nr:CKS-domain-containing protein [Gigaspora margarita]